MIQTWNLLSPNLMHALGWTLLHFVWQGTAIAAVAAVLSVFCRRASSRYALLVVALGVMALIPVITFLSLADFGLQRPYPSTSEAPMPTNPENPGMHLSQGIERLAPPRDLLPELVEVWLMGVILFSLRSAGGFLLLEHQRRKQGGEVSDRLRALCGALQKRMGLDRAIRFCECQWLDAPAVVGWFRPVVLLPLTALTGLSEEQLELVITHELAHIQRFDAFVNAFQIGVEAVLFYHPAVWFLNKRIRTEREHCCDDAVISLCGNPVEYARALTLMEEWRSAPQLAMAANRGPLAQRIFHVLGIKPSGSGARIGVAGSLICLVAALLAGNSLFGIAYPNLRAHAASIREVTAGHFKVAAAMQASPAPAAAATPAPKPSAGRPQGAPQPTPGGSYIEAMKAAGIGDLTVDQLIAMKIQNNTPEYVRGLHGEGLHPDADALVAMKIQGVSPEYIHGLRSLGLNPDPEQIVAMKIQRVDAEYVSGLKNAGVEANVDELVAMRIQGVTPDYVRGLRSEGLHPSADELIGMRIQGVTPEYVHAILALGLKPTPDQFIAMRIQGVTAEYIKSLQSAGLKFDVDEVIAAKIQQITQDFIDRAGKHGFHDLTLEKLIQLKHLGILETPANL